MTLILRKLLASSTYARCGTLDALVKKLEKIILKNDTDLLSELEFDFETLEEISDEWVEEEVEAVAEIDYTPEDIEAINSEITDLKKYRELAQRIRKNSKAERLFIALEKAFQELQKLGANQKALIFTESRRTQEFLYNLLEARGYKDKVVQFNGTNTDTKSKEIYKNWLLEHKGTDKVTGSPSADKRAALVDYFRDEATIMIATKAAAEGINLQFCSLIVNFDLPWNPQLIEQRIGRCHRYGQKHDVVVVNFLNIKNATDKRVYELLDQKFQLFDGVFGSSDEVLGSIGNGVDFEKRIAQIYNDCRTIEEIKTAFDNLQDELRPEISEKIQTVRTTLLEHFDDEVREKLKSNLLETKQYLNTFEEKLWKATQYFLNDYAESALVNAGYKDYREVINPTIMVPKYVFRGFEKACHFEYKFDSKSEQDLAFVLENDKKVLRWLRPAYNQFRIYWDRSSKRYEPDFIIETEDTIYMVEPKSSANMNDADVLAKKESALKYCKYASEFTLENNGKPWKYLLVPHNEISRTINFDLLIAKFG